MNRALLLEAWLDSTSLSCSMILLGWDGEMSERSASSFSGTKCLLLEVAVGSIGFAWILTHEPLDAVDFDGPLLPRRALSVANLLRRVAKQDCALGDRRRLGRLRIGSALVNCPNCHQRELTTNAL